MVTPGCARWKPHQTRRQPERYAGGAEGEFVGLARRVVASIASASCAIAGSEPSAKRRSGLGQGKAVRAALEELRAQIGFQPPDLVAGSPIPVTFSCPAFMHLQMPHRGIEGPQQGYRRRAFGHPLTHPYDQPSIRVI